MPTIAQLEAEIETLSRRLKETESQLEKTERQVETHKTRAVQAEAAAERVTLESSLRLALIEGGAKPDAITDIVSASISRGEWQVDSEGRVVHLKDGELDVGVEGRVTPKAWVTQKRSELPTYFVDQDQKASGPAHSKNDAQNPWSPSAWNVTEQSKYIMKEGMTKAELMAHAAGTSVHATGPVKPKPTIVGAPVPVSTAK
jgi:hypothetical protein